MNDWKVKIEQDLGPIYPIFVLETNVDAVRGGILGNLITQLMYLGALDVSIVSTITKKNRPAYLVKVVTKKGAIPSLTRHLITETGTLGVRIREEMRVCIKRELISHSLEISDQVFKIHVKIAYDARNTVIHRKIEFEDLKHISHILNLPIQQLESLIHSKLQ